LFFFWPLKFNRVVRVAAAEEEREKGPAVVVGVPEAVDGPVVAEALARLRSGVAVVGLVRRGHLPARLARALHDPTVPPQRPAECRSHDPAPAIGRAET
jgi:hypothetical protein